MTEIDDYKRLLKGRLARLSRLVDLDAPTIVLLNERSLVDVAFARIVNDEPTMSSDEVEEDEMTRLVDSVRATQGDGSPRFGFDAAINLVLAAKHRWMTRAVLDQCEQSRCPWFLRQEAEIKDLLPPENGRSES